MTPEEVGARLVEVLGSASTATATVSGGGPGHARATVDVPPALWHDAVHSARDELGFDFFDWLSAVDELEQGFTVVVHLWSLAGRHGVLVRTRVPREAPAVASIVDIFPGAAWHERETHEMFGVTFPGHPGELLPLLLPPEFEGHPLRKEFVLASRVAKDWPGAKEPGESEHTATRRQKMRPPGVPDPTEWGPAARRGPSDSPGPSEGEDTGDGGAPGDGGALGGVAGAGEAAARGRRVPGGSRPPRPPQDRETPRPGQDEEER
ncbi:MAG TPA: NADH-quinone oxidoreductase subunit C [Micromonosporaceae bacterium]|nr:NADH-quinone oxidoreductase subunit C [Micromonosporaceae bacterium]